jgi:hypothetical protein
MRRENKYGTNKTIRYCQKSLQTWLFNYSSEQLSINKRNRWKLLDLLKEYTESSDYSNKIIVRHNCNFYQYNGYNSAKRQNPPKHSSFASRPDFIYQPYVNFIKVNQDVFGLAIRLGWKFLNSQNNLEHLLDIDARNISVTLIYFIKGSEHHYSSDWFYAWKHAYGGYFADYYTVCSGDYCPFGPRIRGQQISDSRINQVLFIFAQNNERKRYSNHYCDYWKCSTKSGQHDDKTERRKVKSQRRNKHILTKQVRQLSLYIG